MKTLDWLNFVESEGKVCADYTDRIKDAKSKKDLFDFACEIGGAKFLMSMQNKGCGLSMDTIKEEFKNFINGKCKPVLKSRNSDDTYTSSFYCDYNEDIEVDTTVTVLLGCCSKIKVKDGNVAIIIADNSAHYCVEHNPSRSQVLIFGGYITNEGTIRKEQDERRNKELL